MATQTKVKHTPGEWEVERGQLYNIILTRRPDCAIAKVYVFVEEEDQCDANAKLIAAAPDLLEALKDVFTWNVEHHQISFIDASIMDKVFAAIKKATE